MSCDAASESPVTHKQMQNHNYIAALLLAIYGGAAGCTTVSDNPLIGRWHLNRKAMAATLPYSVEWEFTKDQIVVRLVHPTGDSQVASRNRYVIDVSKSPIWITTFVADEYREIRRGIFRIRGDELDLKQTIGGGDRPVDFGSDDFLVLIRLGQQGASANGSQPLNPDMKSASGAAGSRR